MGVPSSVVGKLGNRNYDTIIFNYQKYYFYGRKVKMCLIPDLKQ